MRVYIYLPVSFACRPLEVKRYFWFPARGLSGEVIAISPACNAGRRYEQRKAGRHQILHQFTRGIRLIIHDRQQSFYLFGREPDY